MPRQSVKGMSRRQQKAVFAKLGNPGSDERTTKSQRAKILKREFGNKKPKKFDVVLQAPFHRKFSNITNKKIKRILKGDFGDREEFATAKVVKKTPTSKNRKGEQRFNVIFETELLKQLKGKTEAEIKTVVFEEAPDAKVISKKPHVPRKKIFGVI